MEENFSFEWKIFSMEWKKIAGMEYGKIVFHSIPCLGCRTCWSQSKRRKTKLANLVIAHFLSEIFDL